MPQWHETKPASNDLLAEFPSVMTDQAIAFREAIEKHSFWTDSSGLSAGQSRLSDGSAGPGAARAFFDVASNLSSTLSTTLPLAGRLYVTSDTTRLYGYTSDTTVLLGAKNVLAYFAGGSSATIASNTRYLVQIGTASCSSLTQAVVFGTAFAAAPAVQVSPIATSAPTLAVGQATSITSSGFSIALRSPFGGSTTTTTAMWRAIGTATL